MSNANSELVDALKQVINQPRPAPVEERIDTSAFRHEEEQQKRPTVHDVQPGKVVRAHSTRRDGSRFTYSGRMFKVYTVDWVTRQFTAEGESRTLFFSFDDFEVTDLLEPLDMTDPEVRVLEAKRALEQAEADKQAALEAKAAADAVAKADAEHAAKRKPLRPIR